MELVATRCTLFIFTQFVTAVSRIIITSLCALTAWGRIDAAAPGTSSRPAGAGPDPSLAAWLAAQPKWSMATAVEAGFGFKDNLLLSSIAEERSSFARGGMEVLVLRVPTGTLDYSLFAQAEGTRYFSGRTVKDEATAWFQTEPAFRPRADWKLALPLTAYYSDRVFDVSDTEVERLVAELKMSGVKAGPTLRWSFHPAWWIETQAIAERKRYEDGANDGRVREGAMRLGWSIGKRAEARLTGAQRWRDFDFRPQYSAAGRELAGTRLKIDEREVEGRLDVKWDEAARWRSTTRGGVLHYRDNGSGFFNFRETKIDHELEWSDERWLVRLGGTVRRIDFGVQTVGIGINPPPRLKDEYSGELRLERKIARGWTALAAYEWERSRSNDRIVSYVVNEVLLGVRWSWER